MRHRDNYREHAIRTSLQSHVGSATDARVVTELQERCYHENRGIYFTAEQLQAMPWDARALIESQGRKIFGRRRGGC